ncbi:hypothetical protein QIS74_07506 [Colletotrichum tabaci]|uniref:Uncharacterized protein n=1 Tax=Colletotrichum tabaci TaxID=1209068 RepID=A0AAV9TBV8_9PEZI
MGNGKHNGQNQRQHGPVITNVDFIVIIRTSNTSDTNTSSNSISISISISISLPCIALHCTAPHRTALQIDFRCFQYQLHDYPRYLVNRIHDISTPVFPRTSVRSRASPVDHFGHSLP